MRLYLDIHVFLKYQLDLSGIKDKYGIQYIEVPFFGKAYYIDISKNEMFMICVSEYQEYIYEYNTRHGVESSTWFDLPNEISYTKRYELINNFLTFVTGFR